VSPRMRDRSGDAIPSWNSEGNVHNTREGSPHARSPSAVMPTLTADCGLDVADLESPLHRVDDVIDADIRESHRRAPADSVIVTKRYAACGRCR